MNNVVIRCLCFVQLIPFASNRLHSKPHLADELNRGSYNERQHGILHLPKGASWQSRGCWVFSSPTGEALKRNSLEMAVEWGGGRRQWHRKMAVNLWRSCGVRQTGNQWGESGRWRITEHWLGDWGFFWFTSLRKMKDKCIPMSYALRNERQRIRGSRTQRPTNKEIHRNEQ